MDTHGHIGDFDASSSVNPRSEQDWIQAAFEAHTQTSLIYNGELAEQNLYHVTRMVAADPHCLRAHVRRIFLAIHCRDVAAIQGALLDLFLVLKGRGQLLFNRLLSLALLPFSKDVRGRFEAAFSSGDLNEVMQLPAGKSVLVNGRNGSLFHF